jgi:putative Mn2+ efflux pump MntP
MPMLGWLVGSRIGAKAQSFSPWIAFVLLGGLGSKMIFDAWRGDKVSQTAEPDPFAMKVMFTLAVATSLDALAVGFTLPLLNAPFALSVLTIGLTTAVLSTLGLFAGRRFGALLGGRLDTFGGLVLLGLGVKILVQHLWP